MALSISLRSSSAARVDANSSCSRLNARFRAFNRLQDELASTRAALEERKLIDKAKLFLMRSQGLSEDEAYQRLRTTAMRENKRIGQIAEAVVTSMGLLGPDVTHSKKDDAP